jgi:uncharacterized protein (UPF0332 family)
VTAEGRRAATSEELDRALEELRAAEQLLGAGLARISLTRAYFAAFHAARAFLYAEGLEPRSHHGVLHLFNLHAVKAGRFDPAASRLLARLQKFREEADYGESFPVDERGAREELEAAQGFVTRVREMLGLTKA